MGSEVYKCLPSYFFENGIFKLVPIRLEDKYEILKMRNEQLYHLRQVEPLTIQQQDEYFEIVISKLFEQVNPHQLLFSFLRNNEFIGYGGLVHINWVDQNAELSFIMKTSHEKENFGLFWTEYLQLIEDIAFKELNFHKIYTYAFDLRPHLYGVLEECGFLKEAILKEHCFFSGEYIDVVIHSKINR